MMEDDDGGPPANTLREPHAKSFNTDGLWLFGGISVVLALGQLIGLWAWSWWRVGLPLLVFLSFNVLYAVVGLLYLSVVSVRQRAQEEEADLLRTHTDGAAYWTGFVSVGGLTVNLVSRLEAGGASRSWWLFAGRPDVMVVLAAWAVLSLWWYWSQIGRLLNECDDRPR